MIGDGAESLSKLRRLVMGLMRKVKDKQTVPTMLYRAALSTEFKTTLVAQLANLEF